MQTLEPSLFRINGGMAKVKARAEVLQFFTTLDLAFTRFRPRKPEARDEQFHTRQFQVRAGG